MPRVVSALLALGLILLASTPARSLKAQMPTDAWRLPPIELDAPPDFADQTGAAQVGAAQVGAEPAASEQTGAEPAGAEEITVSEPEEVIPGPWYYPSSWISREVWDGSVELGINGTEGNAQAFTMRAGSNLTRKTELYTLDLDFSYSKTTSDSVETQHVAMFDADLERAFHESPWTVFARMGLLYDEFTAFDVRLTLNSGFGYRLIDTDITKLTGRFGAGVSHEFGGPDDRWVPEAVFGMDFERQLTKRQKLVLKFDYYPEWGDFLNYRLVSDLGWELLLDEEANLSLKLAVVDRYDSTPNGLKPNDINYSLLLLWKL